MVIWWPKINNGNSGKFVLPHHWNDTNLIELLLLIFFASAGLYYVCVWFLVSSKLLMLKINCCTMQHRLGDITKNHSKKQLIPYALLAALNKHNILNS